MNAIESQQQYFEESFKSLDLQDLVCVGTEFEECTFVDCNFTSATFERCNFINCSFTRCQLSLISVPYTRFFTVSFTECKLVGVDWTRATWSEFHKDFEISFRQSILNDSSFFGLTLQGLILDECKVQDVDFREGDFSHAVMTYSDFTHSLFMRTNLQSANFAESSQYSINILENQVQGAKFSKHEAVYLLESLGIELVD
ncbi:MAG TPA: pentapeptide repeat-containing protein [Gammaproteobacteria bacterium]|nr:pentapeptide repeat-containing protein [Gammaproteobacteria bacterium]